MTEPTSRFRAATPAERAQIHMMEGVPFATGHLQMQTDAYGHFGDTDYARLELTTYDVGRVHQSSIPVSPHRQIKYTVRGNELCMEEEEKPPTALTINSRLTDEYGTLHVTDHNLNWQGATSLLAPMSLPDREALADLIRRDIVSFVREPNDERTRIGLQEQIRATVHTFLDGATQ